VDLRNDFADVEIKHRYKDRVAKDLNLFTRISKRTYASNQFDM
jgi:hypothetical protein